MILFCSIRLLPACAAAMARLVPPFLPPDIGWIDPHKGLEMGGRAIIDFSLTLFYDSGYRIEGDGRSRATELPYTTRLRQWTPYQIGGSFQGRQSLLRAPRAACNRPRTFRQSTRIVLSNIFLAEARLLKVASVDGRPARRRQHRQNRADRHLEHQQRRALFDLCDQGRARQRDDLAERLGRAPRAARSWAIW
jgi:hypothetical protein